MTHSSLLCQYTSSTQVLIKVKNKWEGNAFQLASVCHWQVAWISDLPQQPKPKHSRLDSSRANISHVKFRKGMLYRNKILFYSCTAKVHRAYIHSYLCHIKECLNYHAQWNINGKYKKTNTVYDELSVEIKINTAWWIPASSNDKIWSRKHRSVCMQDISQSSKRNISQKLKLP